MSASRPSEELNVPLNSTVTLSSVNWLDPELKEDVVGDLSESNLDKTFNLETAASLPESPESKPDPDKQKSATVVKNRPPPLEKKPAVPPKPIKMLLANPARRNASGAPANLLKPKTSAMKRPKIKSPCLPSPGRVLIPVKKAGGLKEVSPAALKNPLGSEISLRRKGSLSSGITNRAASPVLATSSSRSSSIASKPSKEVGKKSFTISGLKDKLNGSERGNNNQTDVKDKNKVVTAPQVKLKPTPAQSVNTGLARSESVGSTSSLQRRRKSVGDVMKSSSLASKKPSASITPSQPLSVARLASQPRRSLSNSSLKRSSEAASRAPVVGRPSQKTSLTSASSLTPSLQSSSRRNSVGLQSKISRDTPSLGKSESGSRLKSSRPNLVKSGSSGGGVKKPARSEDSQHHKDVLKENTRKFDVLAVVTTQVMEENDKLENIIKKNKLQLAGIEGELEICKVKHKSDEESFKKLLSKLSSDIETMCVKHQEDKESLRQAHQSSLDNIKLENKQKVSQMKRDYEAEIRQLKQVQKSEVASREEEHAEELDRVIKNYEEKIEKLQVDQEQDKTKLQNKIHQLENKLGAFVGNLMTGSDVKEDFIKELKQEIESLRAVVEMKNDELKSARQEKENLNQSVSSLNESQRKVESLTHQVEDLKEILDVKRNNERRLDVELLRLEQSVRSQARERGRLAQEKEELQWKMKQRMKRCLGAEAEVHSQSFSDQTEHSREGNFKTFNFQHASLNVTAPNLEQDLPFVDSMSPNLSSPLTKRKPILCSTPSVAQTPDPKARDQRKYHFHCEDD